MQWESVLHSLVKLYIQWEGVKKHQAVEDGGQDFAAVSLEGP
jgi:hypothetical protein